MKKILLVFLFSTISLLTFSQSKERPTYDTLLRPYSLEPFEILAEVDRFYGTIFFKGSKSLVAKDSKLSKGFEISVHMVQDSTLSEYPYDLFFKGIRFRMAGIGRNCVEQGSTLVLELEDGEKLSYSYLGDFICNDGYDNWFPSIDFDISQEVWKKLFNTRVKSMTFTEMRTGDSFSYKLKKEEQEFFMEVKEATTRLRWGD